MWVFLAITILPTSRPFFIRDHQVTAKNALILDFTNGEFQPHTEIRSETQ